MKAQQITDSVKKAIAEENEAALKSSLAELGGFALDAFANFATGINRLADAIEDQNRTLKNVETK